MSNAMLCEFYIMLLSDKDFMSVITDSVEERINIIYSMYRSNKSAIGDSIIDFIVNHKVVKENGSH